MSLPSSRAFSEYIALLDTPMAAMLLLLFVIIITLY